MPSRRTLSTLASLLLIPLASSLTGCESGSEQAAILSPQERAAQVPLQADLFESLGYRPQWRTFATVSPGETINFFQPAGDVLLAQDSGSTLTVLEAGSGLRRWSDDVSSPLIRHFGAERDGKRIIASSEAEVYYFEIETGALADKQRLADVVTTRPAVMGDVLVYGTASNVVLGHHAPSGFRLWGALMSAPTDFPAVPVGDDGTLAMASRAGDVIFLSPGSGISSGRNKMFDGPAAELAASDSAIFIASRDQSLYAFSRDGGSQLWRHRTDAPLRFAPTYNDGRVYCDVGSAGLLAFDAATGQILWSCKAVSGRVVAINRSRLLVHDGTTAWSVDAAKGSVIAAAELENISMLVPEKLVDGSLFAVSPNGVIAKLTPRPIGR